MNYLTVKDIVKINTKLIIKGSSGETIGIKDAVGLDMAAKQLKQEVLGNSLYPTIYEQASVLAINIVRRQPFKNGNKRTALVAMITFLRINGYAVSFSQEEVVSFILNITTNNQEFDVLKEEVSSYLEMSGKVCKS